VTRVLHQLRRVEYYALPDFDTVQIPAEVFPTEYRCTFYGIAAAAGKVGSVIAQAIARAVRPSQEERNNLDAGTSNDKFKWLLLCFSICMALGAIFSELCIPRVQERSSTTPGFPLENISLEDLASGRKEQTRQDDTEIGLEQRPVSEVSTAEIALRAESIIAKRPP
jgi:PHS family inorganic phosphate transporter-like MFS transporter